MPTDIAQQKLHTVQDATRQGQFHNVGMLFWLASAGQIIDPWWSKSRDKQLRSFWKDSDHFAGAMYMMASKLTSVPQHVEPRDTGVKAHIRAAQEFEMLLDEAPQFGQGWSDFWTRFLISLWTQDNGAFGEVIGDGDADGPIKGPPLGLAHLDSYNCQRTSDPEFPVIFTDASGDGKRYKFHYTRIVYAAQLPSAAAEMYGVGFSWLSRAVNVVQNLVDISIYKQEKLGSRPLRAILTASGVSTEDLVQSIGMAEEKMDNQGLGRYAKLAVLGSTNINQPLELNLLDLASMPDGFEERTATELAMFVIALAGGFPPRWLWPATTTGATKADALYSHISGTGGGATWHLNTIQRLLGGSPRGAKSSTGKFLPPYLKLVFDYQDDEQDRLQSDIRKVRSDTRKTDLESGVTDVRVEREQMVSVGDLTPAQFNQLELDAGRLPDGSDVLTLFSSTDGIFIELLDLGIDDPLLIDANDPVDMMIAIEASALDAQDIFVNAPSAKEKERARQAQAALGMLKDIYQELVIQEVTEEQIAEQEAEGQETEGGEGEQEEETEEMEEKAFNFGAKVGEVISGQLARGEGGRFASASDVAAARSELLQGLIGRLRARRGGGTRGGAAATKKASNRVKVAGVEGVGEGTIDGLSSMRQGEDVDPATAASLQSRGLAEVNPDGSVTMTTAGRKLLGAANSGDVDRAKKALSDAKKAPKGRKRGGGKPKKTPEQIVQEKLEAAQKREQEKREKLEQARSESFDRITDEFDIEREDMDALQAFREGGALDGEIASRLAEFGLVEVGTTGKPVLTKAGESAMSAAEKGDARKMLDAITRALEQMETDEEKQAGPFELEFLEVKSIRDFRANIRSAVRGLWTGAFNINSFVFNMVNAIEKGLRQAFIEGTAECGFSPDEMSEKERAALQGLISEQSLHIFDFGSSIEEGSKANGGKLGKHFQRSELWINQYPSVQNQAKQMACKDKKLKWVIDLTKDNCKSCLRLNGKVKRASFWQERGIEPRNPPNGNLECDGWHCGCDFEITDEPLSKGPLPKLP